MHNVAAVDVGKPGEDGGQDPRAATRGGCGYPRGTPVHELHFGSDLPCLIILIK